MERVKFDPQEMRVIGEHIVTTEPVRESPMPKIATPITPKENIQRALRRDGSALWFPMSQEMLFVESRTNLDHVARAEVRDMGPVQKLEEKGGPDLFGVEWEFVPVVGGSMVKPGKPVLTDANDWEKVIKFPDVDKLDWEGCKINAVLNKTELGLGITFQNGLFERLISFMDFENAAVALIDEDQKDSVHAIFSRLCDMYEAMIVKYSEILKLDSITFHDDWGSQRAPFFSLDVCMEMVEPYLKRLVDFCHARGMWFNHHSCGKNEKLVPAMIAAGVDMWMPQPMNDVDMLIEKYGDKMMFGVGVPVVSENADDEEIERAAEAFAKKYAVNFTEKPIVVKMWFVPQKMQDALYRQSRIALCGK